MRETAEAAGDVQVPPWDIFREEYPLLENHVDFIKKIYRVLMNELKSKGKKMTSQKLSAELYSPFCKDDNDELGDLVLQNPKIAKDALEILETEVDEIVEAKFNDQNVIVNEFRSLNKDPYRQVERLYNYINKCDRQFKAGSQTKWYSPYISICHCSGWGRASLGLCANSRP